MLEQAKTHQPKKAEKKVRVKAKTEDSPSKESDQKDPLHRSGRTTERGIWKALNPLMLIKMEQSMKRN